MQAQTYLGAKQPRSKAAHLRLADLHISLDDAEEPGKIMAKLPVKNYNQKEQLRVRNEEQFPKWLLYLRYAAIQGSIMPHLSTVSRVSACVCCRQGFSVLLYGLGSKRQLLHSCANSLLSDGGVLSIAGHSSSLTAKQIVMKSLSMLQRRTASELK